MSKYLKIAHLNCNAFNNKYCDIYNFINTEEIDILSLNETFFKHKSTNHNLINGYIMLRCDREYSNGGGVAIIIRNTLKFQVIKSSSNEDHELIAIEIEDGSNKIVIVSVYTPPSSQSEFSFLNEFLNNYKNLIIIGDLNALHPMWFCNKSNKKGKLLAEIIEQKNIIVLNDDQPTFTRSNNILDLALVSTSLFTNAKSFKVHSKKKISDHHPISFTIDSFNTAKDYEYIDWKIFQDLLQNTSFETNVDIYSKTDLEFQINKLNEFIKESINRSKKKSY